MPDSVGYGVRYRGPRYISRRMSKNEKQLARGCMPVLQWVPAKTGFISRRVSRRRASIKIFLNPMRFAAVRIDQMGSRVETGRTFGIREIGAALLFL